MRNPAGTTARDGCHRIHIGGIFASRGPAIVRTVLGSCIAVCLFDPEARVGGMNHFMLPAGHDSADAGPRYGVYAMEMLINACMNEGADRRRMRAKVFGGGHVIKMRETENNIPKINIRFAVQFMKAEHIPIDSHDWGGFAARDVIFYTDSARVLMKRLSPTGCLDRSELDALEREERAKLHEMAQPKVVDDSNVTLF